jgi:hypothetical protein
MDNDVPTVVCYECQEIIMEEAEESKDAYSAKQAKPKEKAGIFVKIKNRNA